MESSNEIEENCSICLEPYGCTNITTLPCNHTFHQECILKLRINLCPLCREPFNMATPEHIYVTPNEPHQNRCFAIGLCILVFLGIITGMMSLTIDTNNSTKIGD